MASPLAGLSLAAAALLLAACGGSGGGGTSTTTPPPPPPATTTAAAETEYTIASAYTGISYPITVRTPPGYAGMADKRPTIYAPDREFQHTVLRDVSEGQQLGAIIVSVSQISGDRRFVDYEMPGVEAYDKFIKLELLPFVEARYGVDPARRALVGYSLSGLQATISFLKDGPDNRLFSGILTSDPSLQIDTGVVYALEQALADSKKRVPVRYQTCYTAPTGPLVQFPDFLRSRNYEGLQVRQVYIAVTHAQIPTPCITEGLKFVLGG